MRNNRFLVMVVNAAVWLMFLPARLARSFKTASSADNKDIRKILIMELWGIGDAVMMSAVLKPLRQRFPEARICLLAKPHARPILEDSGIIDEFIEFDFPWTKFEGKYRLWQWPWAALKDLLARLRSERFDLSLDARGDIRNNVLSFLIGAERRLGFDWTGGGYLLTDRVGCAPQTHRVDCWKTLLKTVDIDSGGARPLLAVNTPDGMWAREYLREKSLTGGDIKLGIHPGAGHPVRRWPLEHFVEAANRLTRESSIRPVVFIDPDGYGDSPDFDGRVIRFQGSLKQTTALIRELDMLLCNDTGLMHIAAALGTPVTAVFGPGDARRIGPYGEGHRVVQLDDVFCRPCYDRCRFKRPFCILDISLERVMKELHASL